MFLIDFFHFLCYNRGRRSVSGLNEKKKLLMKAAIVAALCIAAAILTIIYIVPLSQSLMSEAGRQSLCEKVQSYGVFAPLVFIPGGPVELVGGMLFGAILGTIYTVIGVLLGTFLVYLLVRCFGRPLVHFFVSEEKMERFVILRDEKRLEFWVFILFLIPGIPKDLLTYIVPLTKMNWLHFVLLATLARLPSLVGSVVIGDSLTDGRYWLCITICAIAAAAVFAGYQLRDRILERNHPERKE